MTNYNTQELDEILFELANYAHGIGAASGYGVFVGGEPQKKAKQAILDWHNKQVEELLDRLEKEINTGRTFSNDYVISEAIETERNKLKKASEV